MIYSINTNKILKGKECYQQYELNTKKALTTFY